MTEPAGSAGIDPARLAGGAAAWRRHLPLMALSLTLLALAGFALDRLAAHERVLQAGRLQAIAGLKAENIAEWMKERHDDARIVQGSVALRQLMDAIRHGTEPAALTRLHTRLRDFLRDDAFDSVQLVDAEGTIIASAGTQETVVPALESMVREAIASNQIMTNRLERRPGSTSGLHLDFVVPIRSPDSPQTAAVILHADPGRTLFPRIQNWPYPSPSAEALLVRREDDQVRFLNELRFRPNAALYLASALEDRQRVEVQLVSEQHRSRQLLQGLDYREVPVLAIGLPVPGTNWFLLAKMDRAEVYAAVWREAGWIAAVTGLAVLALAIAFNSFRQRQTLAYSQAAALRREEEAQHRKVMFDQSRDGMVVLDRQGNVREVNRSFADMHGYALDEARLLHVWDWEAALGKSELLGQLALEPLPARTFETRHRRRDGTEFDVELTYNPMQWDSAVYVFCVVRDISARKAIQASLQESEERFKYALLGANAGLWDWDLATDVVHYSSRWKSMLGYDDSELEDTLDTWKQVVDPARRDEILALAADFMAGRVPKFECEFRLRHKDGHDVEVLSRASLVRAADGHPIRLVGTHIDITERKRAEARLREANETLRRTMAEVQRHEAELTLIAHLNDLLQACATTEEAYRVISVTLSEFPAMGDGHLAVTTPGTASVAIVARWGAAAPPQPEFRIDECWALRLGQMHVVGDPAHELTCGHAGPCPGRGYLCVPLIVKGEVLGVVTCTLPAPESGETSQRLILNVSEVLKLSLSNLRLRESLHVQATHDTLTGLFNRGYLDEILPRELQRADRRGATVCVAMLDLDHFKAFNDSHGHEAGDLLLREFGRLLQSQLRKSDIACRYGGEEFAVILVDTSLERAWNRLDGIREACAHLRIELHGRLLPPAEVSIGMAEFPSHGRDPQALLRAADSALYTAKREGRNRVTSFTSH